jgi:hypothetical protein
MGGDPSSVWSWCRPTAPIEPECQAGLDVLARRGYAVRTLRGASQVDLARSA